MSSDVRSGRLAIAMSGIGRRVVLSAAGEIDIATADVLAGALEDAIDSGAADVWVDLTQVDFMDSSGAHALLDARTRTVALNRHLCVICPPGEPRRVLELTRLTGLLGVATSRAAAHQAS